MACTSTATRATRPRWCSWRSPRRAQTRCSTSHSGPRSPVSEGRAPRCSRSAGTRSTAATMRSAYKARLARTTHDAALPADEWIDAPTMGPRSSEEDPRPRRGRRPACVHGVLARCSMAQIRQRDGVGARGAGRRADDEVPRTGRDLGGPGGAPSRGSCRAGGEEARAKPGSTKKAASPKKTGIDAIVAPGRKRSGHSPRT